MNGSCFDSGTNHAFRQFISAFGAGETKICFQFPSVINLMISSVFLLATGYTF
jgi:hypothetical protein